MSVTEEVGKLAENIELVHAIKEHDVVQAALSSGDMGHKAAHISVEVLEHADELAEKLTTNAPEFLKPAAEKLEPILQKLENFKISPEAAEDARGVLGKAAVVLVVAQGIHDVYKEDGLEHKAQRAAVVGATVGSGYAAGAVLSGGLVVGEGVAATGGAAAAGTVAAFVAPVVLAAEITYGANTIIKTERAYESVDSSFKPDMARHSNIVAAEGRVAGRLKELGVTKDAEGRWDLTRPENVAKFEQAVREKKDEYTQVMQDNHTKMPRWIQFTDAQSDRRGNYENAKQDVRMLDSALTEMPGYQLAQSQHHQAKLLVTQQAATEFRATAPQIIADIPPAIKDAAIQMPASLSVTNQVANVKQRG